jgi:hypothetical protein
LGFQGVGQMRDEVNAVKDSLGEVVKKEGWANL